ncbi:MAG: hypothetical protein LC104_00205 [Bacteroidales bacterium]|nr:hypothetical protein [Bacteroidales bacterium]
MRYPQILVCDTGEFVEAELRELAARQRWMLRHVQQTRALHKALQEWRPSVVCLVVDPTDASASALTTLSECLSCFPDVPFLVISTRKVPELQRCYWTAAVLDLGARAVLYPPIVRSVLEDWVRGLMVEQFPDAERRSLDALSNTQPIDLATGEYEVT